MAASLSQLLDARQPPRTAHCEQHGAFESVNYFGKVWSKCPACDKAAAEKEKAREQEQERKKKLDAWQERMEGSGIPERF